MSLTSVRVLSFPNQASSPPDVSAVIERALAFGVDVIVSPGTTNDFGPYYLGSGTQVDSHANFKATVRPYLRVASDHGIQFVMSVGLAGGRPHLMECLDRIDEICSEDHLTFRLGVIDTEIDRPTLHSLLERHARVPRAFPSPALSDTLTHQDVDRAERVVGLLGPEPIGELLGAPGIDGVVTGRAFDNALFMALPLAKGIPRAIAGHAGKILEICGLALEPPDGRSPTWARIDEEGFEVRSLSSTRVPTVQSVMSGMYYERSNPGRETHPGGILNLSSCEYEVIGTGIRCRGAEWIEAPYSVLIEGAALIGYRSIVPLGVRDQVLLDALDVWIESAQSDIDARAQVLGLVRGTDFEMSVRVYGKDGVLGPLEPESRVTGHEAAVILDVVARSQKVADQLAFYGWERLFGTTYRRHGGVAGGGCAVPFSPIPIAVGEVFEFNINHILPLGDPMEPFLQYTLDLPKARTSV